MTTSSVSSAPTVSLGNAQDVSGLVNSSVGLSLADAVTSKVQPYLDKATALQTEINTNHTQIAAYQSMQSLLTALQSAASNLTTESLQGTNVFQSRAANLSTDGTTPAASILSAAVANGTDVGTHTVQVNQLAQNEADTSATLALSATDPISNVPGVSNGTITIAETGKASPQAVTISASMTLSQVAAAINAASTANGVSASVVSVDSSHQVLVLTAQDADTPISFTDPNSILNSLGVVSGSSSSNVVGTVQNPVGQAGTFTIRGGSDSAAVTLTGGEDATTIANMINTAAGSGSEINAVVNVNGQVEINDLNGNPVSFSDIEGTALSGLGLSNVAMHQVTHAQALNLTVDGVTGITRDSNTVSDVLSGVTLNVTQLSNGSTVTIGIAPNANSAATAIQSFVTAYNSWEGFVQQNEATDSSGAAAASAVLFGDATLRQASLEVDSSITQEINNTSLGALGISLDNSNNMQIDSTTLDDALNNNFQTVANLFQSTLTSTSPNLVPSGSNLSSFAGSLSLTIGMTGNDIGSLSVMANGQNVSSKFIFAGNTIQGLFGTPYSGMFFSYNGTGETATVNSTQGIGNMVYDAADKYANTTTGTVQSLVTSKQTQDLQYTSQYNNWVNEANNYTDFLLNQYSALTSQIQSAGQTLSTLNALFQAQFSSNG